MNVLQRYLTMNRFKKILCVVDTNIENKPALERAIILAENNKAHLTVVEVIDDISISILPKGGPITTDLQAAQTKIHLQLLDALLEPYREHMEIESKLLIGIPFLEVIHEVLRNNHDLLIKIPENQDWLDRLFGSDDMHLLRKCPCPVWLIKPHAPSSFNRILAAVDVDESEPQSELDIQHALNLQVLEIAGSLAISNSAELHIINAWEAIGESVMHSPLISTTDEEIRDYVDTVRKKHEINLKNLIDEVFSKQNIDMKEYHKPKSHLVNGTPRQQIPAFSKRLNVDLIVMGTVARTGLSGFIMGNTAETILNQIDCSVLAIKPSGFVTPVEL